MDKTIAQRRHGCLGSVATLTWEGTTLIVSFRPCVTHQARKEMIISVHCGFPASRNRRPPGDQAGRFLGRPTDSAASRMARVAVLRGVPCLTQLGVFAVSTLYHALNTCQ